MDFTGASVSLYVPFIILNITKLLIENCLCFHLVAKNLRECLQCIPFSVRRILISKSLSRRVLNLVTSPIGDEYDWIEKVKHDTWKGVWIAPDFKNMPNGENRAKTSDLVILYIHGN